MAIVALCFAKSLIFSDCGFGVLPSGRVIMIVWETSGSVNSACNELIAPNNEDTPGTISTPILYFFNSSICSLIAP